MTKLAVGPVRVRHIVWSLWLPALAIFGTGSPPVTAVVPVLLGLVCAMRSFSTRVEIREEGVTVVNFFRTIRLPSGVIRSAGFAPTRWWGGAVPLILVGDDLAVRASGVSAWARMVRWKDQPIVSGRRVIARVEHFFKDTGIVFDPREPVRAVIPRPWDRLP